MADVSEPGSAPLDATALPDASVRPTPMHLLRIWLGLGIQSFGGGSATLYLIRRAVVEQQRWITDEEFARNWAICQITPGINLLGLTILIGWRLGGALGVALALGGLLLPSISITVLLTAVYASVRDLTMVQSALHGVIPATVGMGLLLIVQMVQPPLRASQREGRSSLVLSSALLVGSVLAVALVHLPVMAVLFGAGGLCALFHWIWSVRRDRRQA